ncbi:MAG: 2-oxoglutarate dehydrogenase complex dihydrolipoyllysine-residue succinyltransferase [Nitrospiraceae bacterium]
MSIELKVPTTIGESITEVQIADWLKLPGETVLQDEPVVSLETDKVALDLPAPVSGVLIKILKKKGETAEVGEVIAHLEERAVSKEPAAGAPSPARPETAQRSPAKDQRTDEKPPPAASRAKTGTEVPRDPDESPLESTPAPPVLRSVDKEEGRAAGEREEESVPMSPLRRRVAERLVEAQQTAALLTTFNEIDMTALMGLRHAHQEAFQQRHSVKLGLMSFFVRAAIDALKLIPELNAEIRGRDLIYRRYYDIGIAIGSGRGLVVPVLRNAHRLGFAEIELAIADFAKRAQSKQLTVDELQGGTFTITNGGIYGSLLSTPIVNPPQSGILGLHAIQDRPVARNGQVVIRPMMYVALTYDHRIVDGREAVSFLKQVKVCIEEPARMLLGI